MCVRGGGSNICLKYEGGASNFVLLCISPKSIKNFYVEWAMLKKFNASTWKTNLHSLLTFITNINSSVRVPKRKLTVELLGEGMSKFVAHDELYDFQLSNFTEQFVGLFNFNKVLVQMLGVKKEHHINESTYQRFDWSLPNVFVVEMYQPCYKHI